MNIYCGIDFGTTNTVVSICGKTGKLADSFSIPTTIFIPEEAHGISKVFIGDEAVKLYEEDRPGRYIHSIKRSLSDKYFEYTVINRTKVTLEELLVLFLNELKKMMADRWAFTPENIVLGRPVRFSLDDDRDALAKDRHLRGFEMAGFSGITILEEPTAASLCFEQALTQADRRFLIMDLGGGTSDFTLVDYHPGGEGIKKYEILSVDGVDIGGDNFDEDVMLKVVSPQLGMNANYESFNSRLPMPVHIYRDISKWNKIRWYDRKELERDFSDYLYGSSDSKGVKKLKTVLDHKLSQRILEQIRMTKHELGGGEGADFSFNEYGLGLGARVTDEEFSQTVASRADGVIGKMEAVACGDYSGIDRLILTGGSSRVGYIQKRVAALIPQEKILQDMDFYNSISKGLALYAYYNGVKIV